MSQSDEERLDRISRECAEQARRATESSEQTERDISQSNLAIQKSLRLLKKSPEPE